MNKNIKIIETPLSCHHLSIIRNKDTEPFLFKNSINQISNILSIEAINNLPLKEIEIETPIVKTKSKTIDDRYDIIISPILRAGLGISESLYNIIPLAKVYHLGMYRDEKTFKPVWYYNKLPEKFEKPESTLVYICDPMLATGGSAYEVIKLYVNKNIPEENITFINIISAPEGLNKLTNSFPNIKIITAAIDERLNNKAYIIPGLGDAGDRIFNTL